MNFVCLHTVRCDLPLPVEESCDTCPGTPCEFFYYDPQDNICKEQSGCDGYLKWFEVNKDCNDLCVQGKGKGKGKGKSKGEGKGNGKGKGGKGKAKRK